MKLKKILCLVLLVVAGLSLSACSLFDNMNVEVDSDATGKDSSIALLNEFFNKTLEDANFAVSVNSNGVKQYTENIKGKTSYVINKDDTISCAYIADEHYYYASTSKDIVDGKVVESRFYVTSDESKQYYSEYAQTYYEGSYCQFMGNIKLLDFLKDEDGSFTCVFHSEGTMEESKGNVVFKFVADTGYITITATSENDLVKTLDIIVVDNVNESGNRNITMSFKYGDPFISLPDLDKWAEEDYKVEEEDGDDEEDDPNTLAIMARDEFLGEGHVFADNTAITCKNLGALVFTETLSNGIDKIDYGTRQTYTFAKENGDDYDYYYVYVDSSSKYYKINDPLTYGANQEKFYSEYIALFDESSTDYVFECEVVEDTMTFTVKQDGEAVYLITATRSEGFITKVETSVPSFVLLIGTTEFTFEYDVEPLIEPDLTDFENRTE